MTTQHIYTLIFLFYLCQFKIDKVTKNKKYEIVTILVFYFSVSRREKSDNVNYNNIKILKLYANPSQKKIEQSSREGLHGRNVAAGNDEK